MRQYHKLRLTGSLGHSDGMEVDLLHYQRGWIRTEWSVNGVSLANFPDNFNGKYPNTLCNSWAHEICSEDNEERSLVIGSMNEMAYVFQAWLPLVVRQQVDGPEYRKGFITVTVLSVILIISTFVVRFLHNREKLRQG